VTNLVTDVNLFKFEILIIPIQNKCSYSIPQSKGSLVQGLGFTVSPHRDICSPMYQQQWPEIFLPHMCTSTNWCSCEMEYSIGPSEFLNSTFVKHLSQQKCCSFTLPCRITCGIMLSKVLMLDK